MSLEGQELLYRVVASQKQNWTRWYRFRAKARVWEQLVLSTMERIWTLLKMQRNLNKMKLIIWLKERAHGHRKMQEKFVEQALVNKMSQKFLAGSVLKSWAMLLSKKQLIKLIKKNRKDFLGLVSKVKVQGETQRQSMLKLISECLAETNKTWNLT